LCGADEVGNLLAAGLGGVMLQSSDWRGGLRDRVLFVSEESRRTVDTEVDKVIGKLKAQLTPFFTL
jgi:hypothetical protein